MTLLMADKLDPNERLSSGSEIGTYQTCQQKWWFAHMLHLMPQKQSDALFLGNVGHEALSKYYKTLMTLGDRDEAKKQMLGFVEREVAKNNKQMESGYITIGLGVDRNVLISRLATILQNYLAYYHDDFRRYTIEEVEHIHVGDGQIAMRLDLLLRSIETGELVLWDHKFTGNFYRDKRLAVNSQLPLYMRVVRGDRMEELAYGVLNQLRTRADVKDSDKMFERARIEYEEPVARRRNQDQLAIAETLRELYKKEKLEVGRFHCIRTRNDYTCDFCPFWEPCMELLRDNVEQMKMTLKLKFERSSYGYN